MSQEASPWAGGPGLNPVAPFPHVTPGSHPVSCSIHAKRLSGIAAYGWTLCAERSVRDIQFGLSESGRRSSQSRVRCLCVCLIWSSCGELISVPWLLVMTDCLAFGESERLLVSFQRFPVFLRFPQCTEFFKHPTLPLCLSCLSSSF